MFDLIFLLVVGLSTAFAALRGGLAELATILSLALAALFTWIIAPPLLGLAGLSSSFFGTIILVAILLGAFFLAAHIGAHLLLKRVDLSRDARRIDRLAGGAFGFARGLALIGLGFLGYSYYLDEERQPDSVRNALTRPIAAGVAGWFERFAPDANDLDLGAAEEEEDRDGYAREDRASLDEVVATSTTDGAPPARTGEPDGDAIADLIEDKAAARSDDRERDSGR